MLTLQNSPLHPNNITQHNNTQSNTSHNTQKRGQPRGGGGGTSDQVASCSPPASLTTTSCSTPTPAPPSCRRPRPRWPAWRGTSRQSSTSATAAICANNLSYQEKHFILTRSLVQTSSTYLLSLINTFVLESLVLCVLKKKKLIKWNGFFCYLFQQNNKKCHANLMCQVFRNISLM